MMRALMPADFVTVATTMHKRALQRHYNAGFKAIDRWLREAGVQAGSPPPSMPPANGYPVPDDFAEQCGCKQIGELMRYYGRTRETILRWCGVAGCKPKSRAPLVRVNGGMRLTVPGKSLIQTRTTSIYDEAADILRAYSATYRCDDKGNQDPSGRMWRFGNVLMTPDQLLERAERYRLRQAA